MGHNMDQVTAKGNLVRILFLQDYIVFTVSPRFFTMMHYKIYICPDNFHRSDSFKNFSMIYICALIDNYLRTRYLHYF